MSSTDSAKRWGLHTARALRVRARELGASEYLIKDFLPVRSTALLVGDSHQRIEKLLIEEQPQADLLKVGHHGSLTSSSPEFLAAVHPQFAVVSVGFYNPFRHPRPEVMERYAESHIITYRTDLAGAVTFYLNGKSVTARPTPR